MRKLGAHFRFHFIFNVMFCVPVGRAESPAAASRLALEWPAQLRRDPTAVKAAGLRNNRGTADAAIEVVRIKGNALSQWLCPCQGLRIAPGNLGQASRTVDQVPIARRALPLAKRAASSGAQKCPLNIDQRQVESGRVRGLSHRPGGARSGYLERSPTHHNLAHVGHELGWAREIPHGYLSRQRRVCKGWPVQSSPAPLRAGSGQWVKVVRDHLALRSLRNLHPHAWRELRGDSILEGRALAPKHAVCKHRVADDDRQDKHNAVEDHPQGFG